MHLRTLIAPIALGALLLSAGCSFHASVGSRTSGDAADTRSRTSTARRSRVTRKPRVTRASTTRKRTNTAVVRRPTSSTGQSKAVVRANPDQVAQRSTKPADPVYAQSPEDLRRMKEAEEALAKVRAEKAAADADARKKLEQQEQQLAAALQAAKDAEAKAAADMARINEAHAAEMARIKKEHEVSVKTLEEEEAAEDGDGTKATMRRMMQTKNERVNEAREARRKQLDEEMKRKQTAAASSRTNQEVAISESLQDARSNLQNAMRNAIKK